MNQIFSPDRAERLAKAMERRGFKVTRFIESRLPVGKRIVNGLTVTARIYATVMKGNTLRCMITYETIDARSDLL